MILILLAILHGVSISLSQLKRVLRNYGLRRRPPASVTYVRRVEALIRVSGTAVEQAGYYCMQLVLH